MSIESFADGWALWQEHKPQYAEDWIAIAERCLADPTFDRSHSSPLFAALVAAVEQRDALRATAAGNTEQ